MKHFKLKKIKIARINNLNMILGGNNRQTIGGLPDTHTCPPKETQDEFYATCQTTNSGTLKTQGSFVESEECDI
ncbi:hypothetical protein [Kordia jejudonensis]|uniref:hypothetical protein n=1 Tax=Kordia jejudonensis TaxID=1348245 RepID=UPI000629A56C|nr:hypothetical protein [Kordia jejudonensis]